MPPFFRPVGGQTSPKRRTQKPAYRLFPALQAEPGHRQSLLIVRQTRDPQIRRHAKRGVERSDSKPGPQPGEAPLRLLKFRDNPLRLRSRPRSKLRSQIRDLAIREAIEKKVRGDQVVGVLR